MSTPHLGFQLDWDPSSLHRRWHNGPDALYLFERLRSVTADITLAGSAQRVLDVAAAEATQSAAIAARGVAVVALDPSPAMLDAAAETMATHHVTFARVRGLAETLPFADASFDRVLCHSAIDHVADPDLAVREMARVLHADGRLIISAVNYGGLSARLSRGLYWLGRSSRLLGDEIANHQAWDSPVPVEHTFESTLPRLRQLCAPYLDFERSQGVSIGWNVPGWPQLLARLSPSRADAILRWLDRQAWQRPAAADFLYTVFRPRPRASWLIPPSPAAGGLYVQPNDLTYPHKVQGEIDFWNQSSFNGTLIKPGPAGSAWANQALTGDPRRSWLDDLVRRGPFARAAVLGCDEFEYERSWLQAGGSAQLDIYDLCPHALRLVRRGLGPLRRRSRGIRADLNFAALPAEHYDVIWSSGSLHHILNLEHLLDQVARALRPGGIFAVHDFVGERRLQFSAPRLARVNALLATVPPRFRHGGIETIRAPEPAALSPFCGMRPADLLPLAAARFDVLHRATFGYLLPLPLVLDIEAIAVEAPALLETLREAERQAAEDQELLPGSAYAVFRRRP